MTDLLQPHVVAEAVSSFLNEMVVCERVGDDLRLDTPFVLQDGHLLRVFLMHSRGAGTVTDGGFAARLAQEAATTVSGLNARYADLRRIARELSLEWDIEFSYSAESLDELVRRLPDMARAVDKALTVVYGRQARVQRSLGRELRQGFRQAGLEVQEQVQLATGHGRAVRVDYLVRASGGEAAVELLGGRSPQGASQSLDHAVTNFHVLRGGGYQGFLAAVFEEASPASSQDLQARFNAASPENSLLLPSRRAASELMKRLSAA